jgi:hypothetical protein
MVGRRGTSRAPASGARERIGRAELPGDAGDAAVRHLEAADAVAATGVACDARRRIGHIVRGGASSSGLASASASLAVTSIDRRGSPSGFSVAHLVAAVNSTNRAPPEDP